MSVENRFLVEISVDIATSNEAVAASIKKAIDEKVTLFSKVTPLPNVGIASDITFVAVDHAKRIDALTSQLNSAHDTMTEYRLKSSKIRVALEDSLGVLENIATVTLSKKLQKFVEHNRKLLDSIKN